MELGPARVTGAVSRKVSCRPSSTHKLLGPVGPPLDRHVPLANRLEVWRGSAPPSTVIVFKIRRRNPGSGLRPGRSTGACADCTHPITRVPRSIIVSPSMSIEPATDAENGCPTWTPEIGSALSNRTVMSVPTGKLRVSVRELVRNGAPAAIFRSAGTAG